MTFVSFAITFILWVINFWSLEESQILPKIFLKLQNKKRKIMRWNKNWNYTKLSFKIGNFTLLTLIHARWTKFMSTSVVTFNEIWWKFWKIFWTQSFNLGQILYCFILFVNKTYRLHEYHSYLVVTVSHHHPCNICRQS